MRRLSGPLKDYNTENIDSRTVRSIIDTRVGPVAWGRIWLELSGPDDAECAAEVSICIAFPHIMIFWNFRVPPNLLNVPFVQAQFFSNSCGTPRWRYEQVPQRRPSAKVQFYLDTEESLEKTEIQKYMKN